MASVSLFNSTSIPTIVSGINCDTVDYVQRFSPIVLMQVIQLILAFCSVSMVIGGRVVQHHSYFHPNVKVLLKTYHGAILLYGLAMGTAQLYNLHYSVFSLLLFAIPLERTIATQHLGRGYENRQAAIGKFFSWTTVLISLIFSISYHYSDFPANRVCTHCVYDQNKLLICCTAKADFLKLQHQQIPDQTPSTKKATFNFCRSEMQIGVGIEKYKFVGDHREDEEVAKELAAPNEDTTQSEAPELSNKLSTRTSVDRSIDKTQSSNALDGRTDAGSNIEEAADDMANQHSWISRFTNGITSLFCRSNDNVNPNKTDNLEAQRTDSGSETSESPDEVPVENGEKEKSLQPSWISRFKERITSFFCRSSVNVHPNETNDLEAQRTDSGSESSDEGSVESEDEDKMNKRPRSICSKTYQLLGKKKRAKRSKAAGEKKVKRQMRQKHRNRNPQASYLSKFQRTVDQIIKDSGVEPFEGENYPEEYKTDHSKHFFKRKIKDENGNYIWTALLFGFLSRLLMDVKSFPYTNSKTGEKYNYCLPLPVCLAILREAIKTLKNMKSFIELRPPKIVLIGDVHGSQRGMAYVMNKFLLDNKTQLLFMGDYVDRGNRSVCCLMTLALAVIVNPEKFKFLAGNHELASINIRYGFYDECVRLFGEHGGQLLWKEANLLFRELSVLALVKDRMLCMHGGPCKAMKKGPEAKGKIPQDEEHAEVIVNLLWADPSPFINPIGWIPNDKRGCGDMFNYITTEDICKIWNIDLIVRGHQVPTHGLRWDHCQRLLTLFNDVNSGGELNKAVFAVVDEENIFEFYRLFTEEKPEPKKETKMMKQYRAQQKAEANAKKGKIAVQEEKTDAASHSSGQPGTSEAVGI
uniref:SER_THR_PHOSPHATASE domain-containing protein n=1 Tax=Caenorhabditis tropicalis TaxID=1561998 RepID=A0A1I7U685_9PELO